MHMQSPDPFPDPLSGPDPLSRHDHVSRRRLLRLAGAVGVGGALASFGARPALAATGPMNYGTAMDAGTSRTTLTASSVDGTFEAVTTATSGATRPAGVMGRSTGNGIGVHGIADGNEGIGLVGRGGAAQLRLEPWSSGPSSTGLHSVGSVAYDANSEAYWVCVAEGTPGTWRKLADAATAGAFHALPTSRVYDSRLPMAPAASGVLLGGQSRLIPCRDRRDPATGAVDAADLVPAGATAIAFNLTVTATGNRGFCSLEPGTATASGGSTINWGASGQVVANASVVRLDTERQVKVFCAGSGASTHVVLDVVGYYR